MLDLESAIKHCEEVAYQKDLESGFETDNERYAMTDKERIDCKKCASEHRQLAEWLKKLKALEENDNVKEVFKDCDTCKYQNIEPDDYPCDRCMHRYINQYVYDDKREVNADGDSD